jgi:hypothetical protein
MRDAEDARGLKNLISILSLWRTHRLFDVMEADSSLSSLPLALDMPVSIVNAIDRVIVLTIADENSLAMVPSLEDLVFDQNFGDAILGSAVEDGGHGETGTVLGFTPGDGFIAELFVHGLN